MMDDAFVGNIITASVHQNGKRKQKTNSCDELHQFQHLNQSEHQFVPDIGAHGILKQRQ